MLLYAEPTASFPAKIGAKSGTLTIRIYNSRDQQTPPEAVSLLVNGCAAHDQNSAKPEFGIISPQSPSASN
jgi:hypothetical protein